MGIKRINIIFFFTFAAMLFFCTEHTWAITSSEAVKLLADDGAVNDRLGTSISVDGDTAVIGAPHHVDGGIASGSAYIFIRSGSTWTQQAKLTANDGAAFDSFGSSVAVSGGTVVVGARFDDDAGLNSGSAYVFTGSGNTWTQQAKLTAIDKAANDHFGSSVAVSGGTVVVGARFDDDAGSNSGSAYVFTGSGSTWNQQVKLTVSDGAKDDLFGSSVAVSGNTVVIGAYQYDGAGTKNSGSAYVFTGSGNAWTQRAKLIASDAAAGDQFGFSVTLSDDTAVIGSRLDTTNDGTQAGSAYVFVRIDGTWSQQTKLIASDAAAGDQFGYSASVSGDTAVVGAIMDDDDGSGSGSAYVFSRSGTTWSQQAKITASDGAADDRFGSSVAVSGGTAVVGAPLEDERGTSSGSAYVFSPLLLNAPPLAEAGDNISITSSEQSITVITGTITDADIGDSLTYRWLEGAFELLSGSVGPDGSAPLDLASLLSPLSNGEHILALEAKLTAGDGQVTTFDEMILTINNSQPTVAPSGGGTFQLGNNIAFGGYVADFDGDTLDYSWTELGNPLPGMSSGSILTLQGGDPVSLPAYTIIGGLPLGEHIIKLEVDDGINLPVSDEISINVIDTTAPAISVTVSPGILWPPNHKMVDVVAQVDATDNSGAVMLTASVSSSEPSDTDGDGNTIVDYTTPVINQATGEITLQLRAERKGQGTGRIYTITATATDDSGNSSDAIVGVVAPHDKGKR